MDVSVKTYLNHESGNPEIRRFSIPQDASASHAYLVEKIRQVYPTLLRKDFKLYWQDKDGEFVIFSSDEELVMALGSSECGDNFKIYITEIDSLNGNDQEKKVEHPGVVCDVCDKEIFGSRFKCLTCPDYDLCGKCEDQGFHPEHGMLRIRTPGHSSQGLWPFLFGFGRRPHHRGGRCRPGPPGGRGGHCRPDPRCRGFPPHHGPPFSRGGHCRRGASRGFGGFAGFGPSMFGNWGTNPTNEETKTSDEKKTSEDTQQQQGQENGAQNFTTFQEVFDHVTQTLAEQFGMGEPWCAEPESSESKKDKETEEKKEDGTSNEQQCQQTVDEDTPMTQEESFIVVEEKTSEEPAASVEQPEESASPKPAQKRPEEAEFQRKLDEAIKLMEGMGFSNESGWLTQLLIAKDFDIGRVIDTLQLRDGKQ